MLFRHFFWQNRNISNNCSLKPTCLFDQILTCVVCMFFSMFPMFQTVLIILIINSLLTFFLFTVWCITAGLSINIQKKQQQKKKLSSCVVFLYSHYTHWLKTYIYTLHLQASLIWTLYSEPLYVHYCSKVRAQYYLIFFFQRN